MRNIAKCKLCKDIIESFHDSDHIFCKCGEISVNNGPAMRCTAKDFSNFLRVDDRGNEIVVSYKEGNLEVDDLKINKENLVEALEEMILSIERLPTNAKLGPVNHYDLLSLMLWLSSFFKLRD